MKTILRSFLPFFLFLLIASALFPQTVFAAGSPHFSELTAVLTKKEILLFASLKNSINEEMKEALQSGIPLQFSFTLQLLRPAAGRENELLLGKNFTHTISYNTLTDYYSIGYTGYGSTHRNPGGISYADFPSAQKALNTINAMPVVAAEKILPGNRYCLRIKAELFHKTLPPGLTKLLPFLRWDDRNIEWQEVNFSY